jgi:hypothetical protein
MTEIQTDMYMDFEGDVWRRIAYFLDAKSLSACAIACRRLRKLCDADEMWMAISLKRWNASHRVMKILGAVSWKEAYRIMERRQRVPRGHYTEKFNICFGKGRTSGIDSWCFIGHTSSARAIIRKGDPNRIPVMELRLCIQNVSNCWFKFCSSDVIVMGKQEDGGIQRLPSRTSTIIARAGKRLRSNSSEHFGVDTILNSEIASEAEQVHLGTLEYIVIALDVECPIDVIYETDLLARVHSLRVPGLRLPGSRGTKAWHTVLEAPLYDEKVFWQSYMELPGGVVLLKDESQMTM